MGDLILISGNKLRTYSGQRPRSCELYSEIVRFCALIGVEDMNKEVHEMQGN